MTSRVYVIYDRSCYVRWSCKVQLSDLASINFNLYPELQEIHENINMCSSFF